jgi:LysM repeat protein
MPDPACYYCDRNAEAECPTCGRLYCPDHGDDVCLRCMAPESATPGALAFRGSLVALAVASLVVLFLLIRPPESSSGQETVRTLATVNPAAATATPTRPGAATTATVPRTAAPATTPGAGTPSATASASPVGTQPAAAQTYTVKAGDTLGAIASQFNTTVAAMLGANPGITADNIQIGTVLKIP